MTTGPAAAAAAAAAALVAGFGVGPATLLLARAALPRPLWLPVTLLLAMGVVYFVWWAFVLDPTFGRLLSVSAWLASVALFAWLAAAARDARSTRTAIAHPGTWLPAALMLTLALAYLFVLLARDVPVNDRFTWTLPEDNVIPTLMAERFETPPDERPQGFLLSGWLASDRPPLQAGLLLALAPFGIRDLTGADQAIGAVAQMGWLPALAALMSLIGCSRRQMTFVVVATACSGFFLLNSLYVWPKLLAAWLFLVALALCFWTGPHPPRVAATRWVLIGLALGLALLAHGGPVFSLLALPVLLVPLGVWRREPVGLALAAAGGTMALLLAPWIYFQQVVDPPGNRIPKMHLAGVAEIDDRGLLEAMRDEYAALSARDYWSGRLRNLSAQVTGTHARPRSTADALRMQQFFHHVPALGVLTLGLMTLWAGGLRRRRELEPDSWTAASWLATYAAATVGIWALLMFRPGSAVIHQGSYVATTLLFMAGAIGLSRWPRALGTAALAVHVAVFAWLWLATRQVTAPPAPWQPGYLALLALLVVVFAALVRRLPDD